MALVTKIAQVPSLAWELPYAKGAVKKKKKTMNKMEKVLLSKGL